MSRRGRPRTVWASIAGLLHGALVVLGAAATALICFLLLPLLQTLARAPEKDWLVQPVATIELPPPPPPPEPEPPKEPEPEAHPPELQEEPPLLDLAQLELALQPGMQEGWLAGDFSVRLDPTVQAAQASDELFSLADLDQAPRPVAQPAPTLDRNLRRRTPATVTIIFVVDRDGRVENPIVQDSTDSAFDRAALAAVKQWRFEPGKRNGQAVRFRMRVPIHFPKN